MQVSRASVNDIPTYVHTYIHTYVRMYIHTYIHTYVHTYIHTYIHTYMHTYIHTYIQYNTIHTYIYTYIQYIHTCIHTYVCTYVPFYSQSTGWPGVVAVMANWFGKGRYSTCIYKYIVVYHISHDYCRRGLIMGVWNSHTGVGNLMGVLIPGIWAHRHW